MSYNNVLSQEQTACNNYYVSMVVSLSAVVIMPSILFSKHPSFINTRSPENNKKNTNIYNVIYIN